MLGEYLRGEYGYLRSLTENQCLDARGEPIPWYTYPAIEQLSKWDFSGLDILEYGSGNSTLWWSKHARSVTSIESSREWCDRVSHKMPANCSMILSPVSVEKDDPGGVSDYVNMVDQLGTYDVIIIDGINKPKARFRCAIRALDHLNPGGLFIIDNSDWLPLSCQEIRDQGFIEIDFSGLGPLNDHSETTSFFFKEDFRIKPNSIEHPGHAIGGYPWNMDK